MKIFWIFDKINVTVQSFGFDILILLAAGINMTDILLYSLNFKVICNIAILERDKQMGT